MTRTHSAGAPGLAGLAGLVMFAAGLLCASVLPIRGALAQPAPVADLDLAEEADLHFQVGIELYREGRYRDALERLLLSNRLVPNRNVAFNIARTYEQMGKLNEAFRYYADFLEHESTPDGREGASRALERIRPGVAVLQVETTPPGATVYIDRRELGPRGRTPRALALPPGTYTVLLELDGHEPEAIGEVQVALGHTAAVRRVLSRIQGQVEIDGEPVGAEVRLDAPDGPLIGAVPVTVELPPGPRVLYFTAPGHQPRRETVPVAARKTARLTVALTVESGTLVVNCDERDALIEIDGQAAGFTPAVLTGVPAGTHTLRVTRLGFRPFEQPILVEHEGRTTVEARLVPLQEVTAASRSAESVADAPASVSLISREEIRAFGYQTLYDALGGTRGVFQTHDRTYGSLGVRGFSRPGDDYGNRVLLTLDGHTLNDDQLGSSYVGHDFRGDLLDVQQIEVVRGPGSVLYGTNAFFGVINVVTDDTPTAPHVSIAADGERSARLRVGGGAAFGERAGVRASASAVRGQGGGLFVPGDADTSAASGHPDEHDAGSFDLRGWWGDFTLQGGFSWQDKRIPTGAFDTVPGDPRSRSEDARGFAELRYEPRLGESTRLYTRLYWDLYRYRGRFAYDDDEVGLLRDAWDGQWVGGEARVVTHPVRDLRLTVGAEVRGHLRADLRGQDASGETVNEDGGFQVFSGFGMLDYRLARWLLMSGGTRFDHFSHVGNALSPRAALILSPTDSDTLKLMGGRAFRAPSPYELFYNDGGVTQVRAGDLRPETITTVELEYQRQISELWSVVVGSFYNRIVDLVGLGTATGADAGAFQYQNLDDVVETVGGEVEARREWRQGWMVAAAYSFQRTRVGGLADGEALPNSPEHLLSLKAAAPIVRSLAHLATRLRAEAPRRTFDSERTEWALLWDLTVTGDIPSGPLSYGLGVRNLLDWRYAHPSGEDVPLAAVPQPGRTLFATLTASW